MAKTFSQPFFGRGISQVSNKDTIIEEFISTVHDFYLHHGRHELLWRQSEPDGTFDAYKILVSEVMLQQTQVNRVIFKYQEFLQQFPTPADLADADLGQVIRAWSGLGYNRRAQYLKRAAEQITAGYPQQFPKTVTQLAELPGIGINTAGAILAYAFNRSVVFIETNIRTVYIHSFFPASAEVSDKQLLPLIAQTLDQQSPREWYWALMDYGSYLKKTRGNLNRQSAHYTKQSSFEGSLRQLRGRVLRLLAPRPLTEAELLNELEDSRSSTVLKQLVAEGLIRKRSGVFEL